MITLCVILFFVFYSKKKEQELINHNYEYKRPVEKKKTKEVVPPKDYNPLTSKDKVLKDSVIIKRLFSYVKGNLTPFVIAFFCMIFVVVFSLIEPLIIGKVYTILSSDNPTMAKIFALILVYAVFIVFSAVINYLQTMSLQKVGQKIIYKIRADVFEKLECLSIEQLNTAPVGKLVTRVTSDTNAINQMYTNVLINLIRNSLMIVGVIIAMFCVNVELAFYVVIITPFIIFFSFLFRKFSKKAYRDVRKNLSAVNACLSENISGIKITQAFVQEQKQQAVFDEANGALKKSQFRQVFVFGIFRPSIYVLYLSTIILVFYLASKKIMDSNYAINYEVIVIFYNYIDRLYSPIQNIAEQFNVLQSALAAAERIFVILDMDPTVTDSKDAIQLDEIKGEIEFKHVWFKYRNNPEWILKDVSFHIAPKETVAFVGATGAGKSTILGLIVRNYDIQKGQILIDGKDIKSIQLDSLRSHIGQMLQDVFLFSGTVASNISLHEDSITDEDIKNACVFVNADKVVNKLEHKYDEKVLERGNNFSSGERQLLSFARVVAHKPNVMILDEATSNIDTETEVLIQDSLHKIMSIGTMLMVAHRLSTIQHADRIIVLNHGEIIESGNHQELLEKRGYYYDLYRLQYQHDEERKKQASLQ